MVAAFCRVVADRGNGGSTVKASGVRRRRVVWVTAALMVVCGGSPSYADDDPRHGRPDEPEVAVFDTEPGYVSPDWLVTKEQEAQVPPGTDVGGCTYESPVTTPNAQPASPSLQLLYVLPKDMTAEAWLDVPRSCTDGSVMYSGLARASRNVASWLDRQSAGLNFRTITHSYLHNWTDKYYSTRSVRRFRSQYSLATWESKAIKTSAGSSPRLSLMRQELVAAKFAVPSTKYVALLHAGSQATGCTATGCTQTIGVAEQGGEYAFTSRWESGSTGAVQRVYKFGCALDGDTFLAHETAHLLGARHVADYQHDLMRATKSSANLSGSPNSVWDYGWDDYHPTVRASGYVSLTGLPGNYFTC